MSEAVFSSELVRSSTDLVIRQEEESPAVKLSNDVLNGFPVDVGQTEIAALIAIG
jgi:hypothetical protein